MVSSQDSNPRPVNCKSVALPIASTCQLIYYSILTFTIESKTLFLHCDMPPSSGLSPMKNTRSTSGFHTQVPNETLWMLQTGVWLYYPICKPQKLMYLTQNTTINIVYCIKCENLCPKCCCKFTQYDKPEGLPASNYLWMFITKNVRYITKAT